MNISEIVQQAKDILLENGKHWPTLFVEYGGDMDMIVLADFPESTMKKQMMLFGAGRRLGQEEGQGKDVRQIIFLTEAWASSHKEGEEPRYARPSEDPARKEVLLAQILDVDPPHLRQSVRVIEMLRDGAGNLVDLLQHEEEYGEVRGMLLLAFLAGFMSNRLSDEQFAQVVARAVRKG